MDLLNNVFFKDLKFEILNELVESGEFKILIRVSNYNDKKKKIAINANYISVECGLKTMSVDPYCFSGHSRELLRLFHFSGHPGAYIRPNSSVDLKLKICEVENMKQSKDGDRIELDVNEGKIASLLLQREGEQWWIIEEKAKRITNKDLKKRINHFENIDEKFGLKLQKFSVKIIDEYIFDLFCEVLSVNENFDRKGFKLEVAIYDMVDNIVYSKSICKYDYEFTGYELFHFEIIGLFIPVEDIGKIIIYPTHHSGTLAVAK